MKMIRTLQAIYGKVYGVLVFAACIFFMLVGVVWFGRTLFWNKQFSPSAFILAAAFITQLVYHKKLAALISGILTLFFSLFLFMEVATNHDSLKGVFALGMALSLTGIISSGILIFSFLKAFKYSENL